MTASASEDISAPLPPLPGHTSRGRLERVLRAGEFADPNEVFERGAIFDG